MSKNSMTVVTRVLAGSCLLVSLCLAQVQIALVPVTATISLEKSAITQHEPLILDVAFNSTSQQSVGINLGYDNERVDVKVIDPEGQVFHKPQPHRREGMIFSEAVYVSAGSVSVSSVVLSDWFDFEKIGDYQIEVTLPSLSDSSSYSVASTQLRLDLSVHPRDDVSLESSCAGLLVRTQDMHSSAAASTAAKALASVKDSAAVPYLAAATKSKVFASMMIDALARLKTEEAIEALISVSRSKDPEARTLARSALVSLGKAQ